MYVVVISAMLVNSMKHKMCMCVDFFSYSHGKVENTMKTMMSFVIEPIDFKVFVVPLLRNTQMCQCNVDGCMLLCRMTDMCRY